MLETGTVGDDRRPALIAAALQSLARDHRNLVDAPVVPFPGGAGIHDPSGSFVWLDIQPERLLGAAIALHLRRGTSRLDIVIPDIHRDVAPTVARRAAQWNIPIEVFSLEEKSLQAVVPAPAPPEQECKFDIDPFRSVISEAGAEVVIEHGLLTGEVAGLEVCRVVFEDEWRLRVGVGSQDREAFHMLHGDAPILDSLVRVVEFVQTYRQPTADPHPLNRLSPERWMRSTFTSERSQASPALAHMPGVLPRGSMSDASPAFAVSELDGVSTLFAFTTGADLGALVDAADHADWSAHQSEVSEIVVVVDGRNHLPVLDAIAKRSVKPMRVISRSELASL